MNVQKGTVELSRVSPGECSDPQVTSYNIEAAWREPGILVARRFAVTASLSERGELVPFAMMVEIFNDAELTCCNPVEASDDLAVRRREVWNRKLVAMATGALGLVAIQIQEGALELYEGPPVQGREAEHSWCVMPLAVE